MNPVLLTVSAVLAACLYLIGLALDLFWIKLCGLDYASPEKKYRLNSLPGENFSGLELMALMHTGFRQVAPEEDPGMGLDDAYQMAQSLYMAKRRKQ